MTLIILPLSSPLADSKEVEDVLSRLLSRLGEHRYQLASQNEPANLVLACTGGVEEALLEALERNPRAMVVAPRGNNAFAAMMEARARFEATGARLRVSPIEALNESVIDAHLAFTSLQGQRIGLLGKVSGWLVASSPDRERLAREWGIEIEQVAWEQVPIFDTADEVRAKSWREVKFDGEAADLHKAMTFSNNLKRWVEDKAYDAVAVECFSLFQRHDLGGCLAIADLIEAGTPASCEGDICSALGMLLFQKVAPDAKPWMANLVDLSEAQVSFAHCTVAPGLTKTFSLESHFETGRSLGIHGRFDLGSTWTILRLGADLRRAWVGFGEVVDDNPGLHSCRTQMTMRLDEPLTPVLGNHHVMVKGDHREALQTLLSWLLPIP